jgi:hypothetical protein
MQQLETTITSLTKRGERLAAKRAAAQEALEKAITSRQQALLAGDLDDQRALQRSAENSRKGTALTSDPCVRTRPLRESTLRPQAEINWIDAEAWQYPLSRQHRRRCRYPPVDITIGRRWAITGFCVAQFAM